MDILIIPEKYQIQFNKQLDAEYLGIIILKVGVENYGDMVQFWTTPE